MKFKIKNIMNLLSQQNGPKLIQDIELHDSYEPVVEQL